MKHSFPICLLLLAVLLLSGGCAYRVHVQGYQNPETDVTLAPGMSVFVKPEPAMGEGDCPVAGNEATRMIADLLTGYGYRPVPEEEADLLLVFSYDHEGLHGRVRFEPQTGPMSGMKTYGRGGPFDHRLWLRVLDNRAYRDSGEEQVIWAGGASLDAAPTGSPRFVAMLLVAALEDFPGINEETVTRKMHLYDERIVALGY